MSSGGLDGFRARHETHAEGTKPMTFRMPVALIRRLDQVAEALDWTRTQVLVALLLDGLEHLEERDPGHIGRTNGNTPV
jgi:hypothetical protein